jgi:glutamate racemase
LKKPQSLELNGNSAAKVVTFGFFDSGVGGLTVLRQLQRVLVSAYPGQSLRFLYLGDTKRCPYGDRSPGEICSFAQETSNWLVNKGADYIIVACNTSASTARKAIKKSVSVPVFDLIYPSALYAASLNNNVTVLSTKLTTSSKAFSRAIKAINPQLKVTEVACPRFVPLVEAGKLSGPEVKEAASEYLGNISDQDRKSIILGCTHYPFLQKALSELVPAETVFIDPAEVLARSWNGSSGTTGGITSDQSSTVRTISTEIYVTGNPSDFIAVSRASLGYDAHTVYGISTKELKLAAAEGIGSEILIPSQIAPYVAS